tara:strand:- start:308 stop:442 length:135 start_codon:yes stop_codon:yes gene_type:complete
MKKKNLIAKDLRTVKYRPRVVSQKKVKEVLKEKKNKFLNFLYQH